VIALSLFIDLFSSLTASWARPGSGWSWAVAAGAYDGLEGNSPAMGAILGPWALNQLSSAYLREHLDNNNSYYVFSELLDPPSALVTGPTCTNVNDMLVVVLERS